MSYSSPGFFLFFLPAFLGIFFLFNKLSGYKTIRSSKIILILFSLLFYTINNISGLLFLIPSLILNYLTGYFLLKPENTTQKRKSILFIASLSINISALAFFKYSNFFIDNLNTLFSLSLTHINTTLPLGISFVTFQQLSYITDCRYGKAPVYDFVDYLLYISFFPQLISGPITLHDEMIPQFSDHDIFVFNSDNFASGLWRYTIGLVKKIILADTFGNIVDTAFMNMDALDSFLSLCTVLYLSCQIFLDFSSYCDMAVGIGKMLNIYIPENFNAPYGSVSVIEFWKRWHITLSRFFRKYIYIPLGGNRKTEARTYLNILFVFLISGVWHGANYTFILWGLLHGTAYVLTAIIKKRTRIFSTKNRFVKILLWLICFSFVNLSWIIFRADSLQQALEFYRLLFFGGNFIPSFINSLHTPGWNLIFSFYPAAENDYCSICTYVLLAISFIFSVLPGSEFDIVSKMNKKKKNGKIWHFTASVLTALLIYWCLSSEQIRPSFLYWNF